MKAAVFDMDGVLVDSEPLWRQAEVETFRGLGVPLTEEMCHDTLGLRLEEAVTYWYDRHPWSAKSCEAVAAEVESKMLALLAEDAKPMPGVYEVLDALQSRGFGLAIATSSSHRVIEAVVAGLDLASFFTARCSAIDEQHGKPDPGVYLSAARALGVPPRECVAFEDSLSGVRSAKSAGMRVIAIPADHQFEDAGFTLADSKIRSLEEFTLDTLGLA